MKDLIFYGAVIALTLISRYVVYPFAVEFKVMWMWWMFSTCALIVMGGILWGKRETK